MRGWGTHKNNTTNHIFGLNAPEPMRATEATLPAGGRASSSATVAALTSDSCLTSSNAEAVRAFTKIPCGSPCEASPTTSDHLGAALMYTHYIRDGRQVLRALTQIHTDDALTNQCKHTWNVSPYPWVKHRGNSDDQKTHRQQPTALGQT